MRDTLVPLLSSRSPNGNPIATNFPKHKALHVTDPALYGVYDRIAIMKALFRIWRHYIKVHGSERDSHDAEAPTRGHKAKLGELKPDQ